MKPLTPQEAAELSEWLLNDSNARIHFFGWMLSSAQFSAVIADEIRALKNDHDRRKNP